MLSWSFLGLGPGGLTIKKPFQKDKCTPGASHGGDGGWHTDNEDFFYLPKSYDRNNTASLLGGSGGKIIMTFI